MPQVSIVIEPWKGHAAPVDYDARVVWTVDENHVLCRVVDGHHHDVEACDVRAGDMLSGGMTGDRLFRVVEVSREV